jgi:T5SS/PEP-CTERM-associated repeat protein
MNLRSTHLFRRLALCIGATAALAGVSARGADVWYTNGAAANFTNANAWSAGVPGAGDRVIVTNNSALTLSNSVGVSIANADVFFDSTRRVTDTLNFSAGGPWLVTNSFVVSATSSASTVSNTVNLTGGTLVVTNASRSALLEIGRSGWGTFGIQGGATVIADRLVATNNTAGKLFATLSFAQSGTLVTYGSMISNSAGLQIGGSAGATAWWYMLGGTNEVYMPGQNLTLGGSSGSTGTGMVVVAGAGTVFIDSSTVVVGSTAPGLRFLLTNGASATVNAFRIGMYAGGSNGLVLVSDPGTVLNYAAVNPGYIQGGSVGTAMGSTFMVSNGAKAFGGAVAMANTVSDSNVVIVTGAGSLLTNTTFNIGGSYFASSNRLLILDGGVVSGGAASISAYTGGCANVALVAGPGSAWSNTTLTVGSGNSASGNQLLVTDQGKVFSSVSLTMGGNSGLNASNNAVLVSGAGSLVSVAGALYMNHGAGSQLTIADGAALTNTGTAILGNGVTSVGGRALVTGTGSLWRSAGALYLGSNGTANGSASVLVTDGGTLSLTGLVSGRVGTGTLTNQGGVLQFTVDNPGVATNSPNSVVVADGTVAFSGVSAANVTGQITRITYTGANTLRLENATNSYLSSYAFSNGSAFSTLDLAGSSAWQGGSLVFGDGGRLAGNGQVGVDTVTVGGTLAPGHSPGSLLVSNSLTLLDSSLFVLEIAGTNSVDYDFLGVGGLFTKAGSVLVTNLGYTFVGGETFNFFDAASVAGAFSNLTLPTLPGVMTWDSSLFESQGILTVVAIPEPSALLVVGAGLALLALGRARARR